MVLPQANMYTGLEKPRLRAVMLQNDAGAHYIYLTAKKPHGNADGLSKPTLKGKYDFFFTVGNFPYKGLGRPRNFIVETRLIYFHCLSLLHERL